MSTELERALSGELGEEPKQAADRAVRSAFDEVTKMLMPSIEASLLSGDAFGGFARGGVFNAPTSVFRTNDGEHVVPLSVNSEIQKRVISSGATELRFNSETMSYAYHKPDQAVGGDGRLHVSKKEDGV